MSDMYHMSERWWVGRCDGEYCVRAESGLLVASCPSYISDRDPTGERTARAIVDAHNAALDAPTVTLETTHPDRRAERLEVAARLMAGMLAFPNCTSEDDVLAKQALHAADALIAAVDAEGGGAK